MGPAAPQPASGGWSDRYAFAGFVLERSQQRVRRADGSTLNLTPRLFNALLLFVEHAGELLDKDTLMRALWPGLVVEENNLNQVIASLRRALGDDAHQPRLIETVPRFGFRFIAEVRPLPAAEVPPSRAAHPADPAVAQADLADVVRPPAPAQAQPSPGQPQPGRRAWLALTGAVMGAGALALWWSQRPRGDAVARKAPVSLAVLPFKPLGGEARDELLEIGMADSVAARLSTLPGLAVLSTGSVLRYAGGAQDPRHAAGELQVDWIVDGTLQRRGEQLRATARLLRAGGGQAVWSGSFDARYDGVFEVQDRIAELVKLALAPTLHGELGGSAELAEPGGTRDPQAYQLYLAARWRGQGGGPDGIRRAVELLRQALAIDPGYALAWTELAWVDRRRLWNADGVPAEVFDAANAALSRALAVVPDLPPAHAGLGFTRLWFDFDWPAAEAEFRRALERNHNVVAAHWGLTMLLLPQGRIDEGLLHLRRSRELDPMSPLFNTMEAAYLTDHGDLDQARRRLDISFDLAPDLWLTHVAHGQLLKALKQPDAAIAALRKAAELGHGNSRPKAVLGAHLAALGQHDDARRILAELQAQAAARYIPPSSPAMVQAALGDKAAALDSLDQAYRWRDARLTFLNSDPSWRGLHGEPRFAALLKQLKLDGLPSGLTPV